MNGYQAGLLVTGVAAALAIGVYRLAKWLFGDVAS